MSATPRSRTGTRAKAASAATESAPEPWVSKTAGLPLSERVRVLRDTLVDSIEHEVEQRNVRVILWLADKLKVLDAGFEPDRKPNDELRSFFDELGTDELREFASLASRAD